jgi:hypothetical protein
MLATYDLGSSGSLVHSFDQNKTRRCKVGIAKEEHRVGNFVVKTYSFVLGDEQVARAFPEKTTNNTPGRFSQTSTEKLQVFTRISFTEQNDVFGSV